jgi:ABC-type transport system involved in multi-copper enzyme maturation permease subunit
MLAYKAWCESRVRFLVSAAALAWFCSLFVIFRPGVHDASQMAYAEFVADKIYGDGIMQMFMIFVLVLGMGGLLQERARGSVGFTLSLPVTRTRLVAMRAGVGLAETAALALMPALILLIVSPTVHETCPTSVLALSAQWAADGAALFALAFLLSTILAGPYAALIASLALLFAYALFVRLPVPMTLAPLFTLALVAASAWIVERQDFS